MTTVAKPKSPVKQEPELSARDLLKATAKKAAGKKGNGHFHKTGMEDMAKTILDKLAAAKELEREADLLKAQLRQTLDPWFIDVVCKHGHQSSVTVDAGPDSEPMRVTYPHRYYKIDSGMEEDLRGILGEQYDTYFRTVASLKVRPEVTEDAEKLNAVVKEIATAIGPERFKQLFVSEESIAPLKTFTERRYTALTTKQNAELGLAGVAQIVSFGEHKGK